MPLSKTAPTAEQGSVHYGGGALSWSSFLDDQEYVPELLYPNSREVYDRMITDTQLDGLMTGSTLPVRRYPFKIAANGARPERVAAIAENLRLPIVGQEEEVVVSRRKGKFSHDLFLKEALRALQYGHAFFEQVLQFDKATGLYTYRKLPPRPQRTIEEIKTDTDGGLKSIKVPANSPAAGGNMFGSAELSVDRLVAFVWDQVPGSWIGRSMMRSSYKNWILKDRLLRVDAIKHERTGMGIPMAEAPPGASPEQIKELDRLMRSMKVTETGGGAVPSGTKTSLMGTTGSVPDTTVSIRLQNEEMSRAFLMMFMQLGQTETGSRSLGESFLNFFTWKQEAIADWYVDIVNAHVIEDWYEWNWDDDEPAPLLVYEKDRAQEIAVADLVQFIDSGVVSVDDELENTIREAYRLPVKSSTERPPQSKNDPDPPPPPEEVEAGDGSKRRRVLAGSEGNAPPSLPLPDRDLRRQLYTQEVQAQVDFEALEVVVNQGTEDLVSEVRKLQEAQAEDLAAQIVKANGDVKKIAAIQAKPISKTKLHTAMKKAAQSGADLAAAEAVRQGREKFTVPKVTGAASLEARAEAVDALLARSFSEAAGRQALRRTSDSVAASVVAEQVRSHLLGLSDAYLKDELGGTLHGALNTGRKAVFAEEPPESLYSSELLDTNTCSQCTSIDGKEYDSVASSEQDYPTGGYVECLGMNRCRGTVIGVYSEASG